MMCTHCNEGRDEDGLECIECKGKGYTIPTIPRKTVIAERKENKDV